VVHADSQCFPRDKVCGDALIPDALQALGELGLRERVLNAAHRIDSVRVYAPNGRCTTLHGSCACLPRLAFDDLLRRTVLEAGVEFLAPLRATAPLEEDGTVVGARFTAGRSGRSVEIRAGTTILATGAASDALKRFGMCLRPAPSATAARVYVRVDERTAREHDALCVAYAPGICPGYGWIFPGPGGVFNVGVGYLYGRHSRGRERNIRRLMDHFIASFLPARGLMRAAIEVGPLRGAPLRTDMEGAHFSRPGLLVVGEAAGLTYSFTGEGIGKSMQSGLLAAACIAGAAGAPDAARASALDYAARLPLAFGDRFRAYRRLQRLVARPVCINLLIGRARPGRYVHRQLEQLLTETGRADELLSPIGLARALLT
jgi:flavin-dependent dehydrogenase